MQKKSAAVFSCFYGYHTDLGSEAPSSSSQEESIHNPLSSLDIPSHMKIKIWNSAQHYLSDLSAICKSPSAGWWRAHKARGLTMSSYQRVTDTYVTVTAFSCSWNLSWSGLNHRRHNSISQSWLKGRKDHIKRLQQRRVQSISETSSHRLKNQALGLVH